MTDYDALCERLDKGTFVGHDLDAAAAAIRELRADNERLREAAALARTVIAVACGEKAPYARIALERIDAALAGEKP